MTYYEAFLPERQQLSSRRGPAAPALPPGATPRWGLRVHRGQRRRATGGHRVPAASAV